MRIVSAFLVILCTASAFAAVQFGPPVPVTATAPAANTGQDLPVVSWSANGPVVMWREEGTWSGGVAGVQPLTADKVRILDPIGYRDAAAASVGGNSFVAWVQNDWVMASLVDANGRPLTGPSMYESVDSRHTMRLAVGASRDHYLLVFDLFSRMSTMLIDAQGNSVTKMLSPTDGEWLHNIEKVAVASDGTEFLLVWESTTAEHWFNPCDFTCPNENRKIHSISIGADGVARPGTEMVLATDAGMPDVAWNGREYVVVWMKTPDGGIAARKVAQGGASAGPVQTIAEASGDIGPRLVHDGTSLILGSIRMPSQSLTLRRLGTALNVTETIADSIYAGAYPRQYGLAARNGRIIVAYTTGGRVVTRTSVEAPPAPRARAVRH